MAGLGDTWGTSGGRCRADGSDLLRSLPEGVPPWPPPSRGLAPGVVPSATGLPTIADDSGLTVVCVEAATRTVAALDVEFLEEVVRDVALGEL